MSNLDAAGLRSGRPMQSLKITSLGGGHGLYQTLHAVRGLSAGDITAVVTVADDGGSSGRIRRELDMVPPGDLRMALAALSSDDKEGALWAEALQHRFGGHGALAGHAVGNLLICGLTELFDDTQRALDLVGTLARARGRVLPMCLRPLDIEADVSGLDGDPRIMCTVRGQVAVATTPGQVRRVRLIPEAPEANPEAQSAIRAADLVTLGPGSWFSSVIPHLLVPGIVEALNETDALKVVVLNLSAEPGETQGFSSERHIHMLSQQAHNLKVDYIIVDSHSQLSTSERGHLQRAAAQLGAQVVYMDVHEENGEGLLTNRHDPGKLSAALTQLWQARHSVSASK